MSEGGAPSGPAAGDPPASEEMFRVAFEHGPLGVAVHALDGRFLSANPALCRLLGYTENELLQLTARYITHPDDAAQTRRQIERLLRGELSDLEFEKRCLRKSGDVVWASVHMHLLRRNDGAPLCFVVHIQDITERRRTDEALRESERHLREAHEIAQMGHWRLDVPTRAMSWSAGIFHLFELDPRTTAPSFEVFAAFVHPEDRTLVAQHCPTSPTGTSPCDLTHRLQMADGRVKHVRRICRAERGPDGIPVRVTGILQDVTMLRQAEDKRARLEQQLQRTQKMEAIGLLAGGVAHDFNNLLTVIGGNVALAMRQLAPEDSLHVRLAEVSKAVESAANLTRQMLAFSRQQLIAPRVLHLNDVIGRLTKMLQRLLGENIELVCVLARELWQVRIDPNQFEQIVINLALNARDAMADGGKLTIQTANMRLDAESCRGQAQLQPGEYVRLSVADTGTGMTDAVKARLFEPFFTTKEQGRGTGLGLAMIYGAIRQNNGYIEVESNTGQGTTFRIHIPRAYEEAQPLAVPRAVGALRGSETIALVEDDEQVRAVATELLGQQGYRVLAYPNGAAAMQSLGESDVMVHLLVTDIVMPGMNGRMLAEQLRGLRSGLRVLFTSGYTQSAIARHGVLEQDIEFLAKPYSIEALATRVRQVLDR